MARISFLQRLDGRYYLRVRMPAFDGKETRSRVFRSALGTSAFAVARRRISLCVAWIVDIKDHPDLIERGALLLRQIRDHLDRGLPLDADVLAARLAFEHYVRSWLVECRSASFAPDEVCPGLTPAWKDFVEQNQAAEKTHLRKATDDAYRRGFAAAESLEAKAPQAARPEFAALASESAALNSQTLVDQFRRKDESVGIDAQAERKRLLLSRISVDATPSPIKEPSAADAPHPTNEAAPQADFAQAAERVSLAGAKIRADRTPVPATEDDKATSASSAGLLGGVDLADFDEFLPEPTDTLSVALEKFLRRENKRLGNDRARERFGLVVPFVIAILGDEPVAQITKRQLDRVDTRLADIPKRTGIPAAHRKSLFDRYRYAEQHGWEGLERLSETTLRNGYHTTLNTFFDWLYQKDALPGAPYKFQYVQDNNPGAEARDVFSPEEALKLASLPLFTGCESPSRIWNPGDFFIQNFLYWGYVLALVTGMRPAEIAQVRCTDLISIEDEEGVVWFFDFTDRLKDAKTSTSRRMVPLLPLVIELGLVERRDILMAAGHDRLFPEWTPLVKTTGETKWGHALSKSWQYIKKKFGFTRNGVTLYSARHWFAQRLDEVGQLAERSRHLAMGHSTSGKSKARLTYGAQTLSLGIARMINSINDPTLAKVSKILLDAKQKADHGELQRIGVLDLVERDLDVVEA